MKQFSQVFVFWLVILLVPYSALPQTRLESGSSEESVEMFIQDLNVLDPDQSLAEIRLPGGPGGDNLINCPGVSTNILEDDLCDGTCDCPGDIAECWDENLPKCSCSENEFLCDGSRCIGAHLVCDGRQNCADGTDEANCENLVLNEMHTDELESNETYSNENISSDEKKLELDEGHSNELGSNETFSNEIVSSAEEILELGEGHSNELGSNETYSEEIISSEEEKMELNETDSDEVESKEIYSNGNMSTMSSTFNRLNSLFSSKCSTGEHRACLYILTEDRKTGSALADLTEAGAHRACLRQEDRKTGKTGSALADLTEAGAHRSCLYILTEDRKTGSALADLTKAFQT
ncbi:unnamed protein product, partial [Meganyctiphanes norvegica]